MATERQRKMKLLAIYILAVCLAMAAASVGVRPEQSAGVKGYLKCDGRPAANVLVKLYDKDRCELGWWAVEEG